MERRTRRQVCSLVAAAVLVAAAGVTDGSAEDTAVSVEQIPPEKQLEQDALDKDLLPEGVPPRCADPDVAVRDPACIRDRELEDFSRSLGLPLIDDPAYDRAPLVPGVTVNQPRRKTLP
jgi:hypothetical protein